MTTTYKRNGFKWNVNELLSLQREFELLDWSIDQMAESHKRTPNAVMIKLDQEGLADYNVLYSNYHNLNSQIQFNKKDSSELHLDSVHDYEEEEEEKEHDDEDYEYEEEEDDEEEEEDDEDEEEEEEEDDDEEEQDEIANLNDRVDGLEDSIDEMKEMLQQMMSFLNKKSVSNSWF